jgi:hypothetical protein
MKKFIFKEDLPNDPPRPALVEWLNGYGWNHCGTLTTTFEVSTERIRKYFLEWIRRLENLNQQPVYYFYAIEYTKQNQPHLHYVILNTRSLDPQRMTAQWSERRQNKSTKRFYRFSLGIAEVNQHDPSGNWTDYITKDIEKNPDNWDLRFPLNRTQGTTCTHNKFLSPPLKSHEKSNCIPPRRGSSSALTTFLASRSTREKFTNVKPLGF